jgi:hypothetical protein
MLIDSSSSHSFISEEVAGLLQGVTPSAHCTKMKVANGDILHSSAEVKNAEWFIQGYSFCSDLRVLPFQHLDMVAGMDWLERYSLMKMHWANKWLTIPYQKGQVTLQGILPGVLDCNIIELMHLAPTALDSTTTEVPLRFRHY